MTPRDKQVCLAAGAAIGGGFIWTDQPEGHELWYWASEFLRSFGEESSEEPTPDSAGSVSEKLIRIAEYLWANTSEEFKRESPVFCTLVDYLFRREEHLNAATLPQEPDSG